jgi:hypothetical protein
MHAAIGNGDEHALLGAKQAITRIREGLQETNP